MHRLYGEGMAGVTIRNLPEDLHEELTEEARLEGRSLNSYLIALLREANAHRRKLRAMRENRSDWEGLAASLPQDLPDPTELIRQDRER